MKKIILLSIIIAITIASCKKNEEPVIYGCTDATADNYDSSATDDDGTCTYTDTTTFPVEVSLISSIDFNLDNPNLIISLAEVGGSMVVEQTLSASDIGVSGQNYFSERLQVDKSYVAKVTDLNGVLELQTTIQISIESWGYDSEGYLTKNALELNFAGQADLNGNYTGGNFKIQIKI